MLCRGTWIAIRPNFTPNSVIPTQPSFFDDIACLKKVKAKIEIIQNCLMTMMKNIHEHLYEWKSFRNLWLFSKEGTCQKFIQHKPTCVGFDEKLLFYYNVQRLLMSKV